MTAVAAVSQHPIAADAAGEVLGRALERIGPRPDLVAVVAAGVHRQFLAEIASLVSTVLQPARSVCLGAPLVLGGPSDGDAIGVLAVSTGVDLVDLGRCRFPAVGVELAEGALIDGIPTETDRGSIGIGPVQSVTTVPTTRAIGPELVVTDAEGPYVKALAGRPALGVLEGVAAELDPPTRQLFGREVVLAESDGADTAERLHLVRGADRARGVLALDHPLGVGSLVRFRLRDPAWAATLLRARLRSPAEAALVLGDVRVGDEAAENRRGPVSGATAALGCEVLGVGGLVPLVDPSTAPRVQAGQIVVASFGPEGRIPGAD